MCFNLLEVSKRNSTLFFFLEKLGCKESQLCLVWATDFIRVKSSHAETLQARQCSLLTVFIVSLTISLGSLSLAQ